VEKHATFKWKDAISGFPVSPSSAEALVRWGGKIKYLLISCLLGNICAKNCSNRTVHVIIIISCKGGTFLRHSVFSLYVVRLVVNVQCFGRQQLGQLACKGPAPNNLQRFPWRPGPGLTCRYRENVGQLAESFETRLCFHPCFRMFPVCLLHGMLYLHNDIGYDRLGWILVTFTPSKTILGTPLVR